MASLEVKGCDGESNAWYENASITVCYEYLADNWEGRTRRNDLPSLRGRTRSSPRSWTCSIHEAGQALFDLLRIPLLGREEDAADQLAGYYMLQFPRETKRRLMLATAYAYASELNVRSARDLHRLRVKIGRHIAFADEHGTPAQRLYRALHGLRVGPGAIR
jgi:hypothetical protein